MYIFSTYAREDCKPKAERQQFYKILNDNVDKIPYK